MMTTYATPAVAVTLNGRPLEGIEQTSLISVTVTDELNLPTMVEMRFSSNNYTESSWLGINLKRFKPGDAVKVAMGMNDTEPLTEAEVAGIEPVYGNFSTVCIRSYDRLYRLGFGSKLRVFSKKSDSQIAAQMARDAGLTAKVEETGIQLPSMIQNNISDLEFLAKRVRLLDYEMSVAGKTFHFESTREGRAPVAELEYRVDFHDLELNLKVVNKGSEVTLVGWDVKNKKLFEGKAKGAPSAAKMGGKQTGYQISNKFPSSSVQTTDLVLDSSGTAKKLAAAESQILLERFIEGWGSSGGNPRLRAGVNIKLTGVGDRFSGTYYITGSTHSYDQDQGYKTTFRVRRTGI